MNNRGIGTLQNFNEVVKYINQTNRFILPPRLLTEFFMNRFLILLFFFTAKLNRISEKKKLIRKLTLLKNTKVNKCSLIFANGPSAKNIDFKNIHNLQEKGILDVFVINHLMLDKYFLKNLNPQFIVLSDTDHKYKKNAKLWSYIHSKSNLKTVTPLDWHSNAQCKNSCIHFNDQSLEGIVRNIDPRYSRGYPSLTALKALAMAIYLGYKKIYIVGFDNSWFLKIKVDERNRIKIQSNHASADYHKEKDITLSYGNNISNLYLDLYVINNAFKKYFDKKNIINVSKTSLIDIYSKKDLPTN
jgi:hypothetical protein